jgi:3-oxoacyl-[acyl-carrier protein] reductase
LGEFIVLGLIAALLPAGRPRAGRAGTREAVSVPAPDAARPIHQTTHCVDKEIDMRDLTGKTALVTGASRGIGRAIAQRLGADGAQVVVHYASNDAAAKQTAAAIEQAGGQAFLIRCELGVDGDVGTLFAGLEAGLSGAPLDILVNNAGILDPTPLEQVTPEAFDRSYAVNVRAPFFIIQRALPLLRDGGRIINVSSATTRIASPFTHYAMGKGAIDVLSHTLAQALGPRGITVNTVNPGIIDTDQGAWMHSSAEVEAAIVAATALGRAGQPADVAGVVAFLASHDARWVTGVTIEASGGQWLGPPMN